MTRTDEPQTTPSVMSPCAGDIVAAKFRVERVLGQGGMGFVVEATNMLLDERVALKLLRPDMARSPDVIDRFAREARSAVRLRGEHVARVSDVGSDPKWGPYIVMELLDGSTLAQVLETSGRLSPRRAVEYVIDACEGLAEAHARGIVHRDVKPGNLFVVRGSDGHAFVKVLDFGISMAKVPGAASMETNGQFGSPHYLSPEHVRGKSIVDHRADIWALGCVLFELLTGEKAFGGVRITELVAKILEVPRAPFPPGHEVPEPIGAIIDRCLAKAPEDRFASAGALALALLPFARRRSHSVVQRAVAHVNDSGIDPPLSMPSTMPPPPSHDESVPSLRIPELPRISMDGVSTTAGPPARETPKRSWRGPSVLLAVAACVGLAVLAVVGIRRTPTPATGDRVDAPPAAAVPPPLSREAPIERPAVAPAAGGVVDASGADGGAAQIAQPSAKPVTAPWPPPKPAPVLPAPAAPVVDDTEIRHTR